MPRDSRPCDVCGGGDDEGDILLCEECNVPVHAHCVDFTGPLGNGWLCRVCKDQAAASPPPEEMVEVEAVDTAAMTPMVGDADFVLALQWEGTYLGWLPDRLLKTIFGPLQLLLTLKQVGFKFIREGGAPWHRVHAASPSNWGAPWVQPRACRSRRAASRAAARQGQAQRRHRRRALGVDQVRGVNTKRCVEHK